MPRFYGRIQGLKLDKGKFTKALDIACQRLVRQAAREGVRALIVWVPVWSGMALGSIKWAVGPGGSLAAFLNVSIPINPIIERRYKNEHTQPGTFNFTSSNHVYRFRVRSDVWHYIHHEFFVRPPNVNQQVVAPWNSFQRLRDAFTLYIRANADKLPKVRDHIVKTDIPFAK